MTQNTIRAGGLIVTLTFLATSLLAQSPRLSANIPFDFYIGSKLLPAGQYVVSSLPSHNGITISNSTGNITTRVTMPAKNQNSSSSRFVFRRYGNVYFLSELQWQGYSVGQALSVDKLEIQARSGKIPETTAVAATR